jgi:hypothetical protein
VSAIGSPESPAPTPLPESPRPSGASKSQPPAKRIPKGPGGAPSASPVPSRRHHRNPFRRLGGHLKKLRWSGRGARREPDDL